MSCLWKLSTPPRTRQTSGSVLDNLRCVGHSAIQQQSDTTRNGSETESRLKRKTVRRILHNVLSAFFFVIVCDLWKENQLLYLFF